jgi:hypothetical protein
VLASAPALAFGVAADSVVSLSTRKGLEVWSSRRASAEEGEIASDREVAESRGEMVRIVRMVRIARKDVEVGRARTSGRSKPIALREADMS